MLRRNLDVNIGLVNGVLGTVTGFKGVNTSITKVTVKFDDLNTPVDIERMEADFEYSKNIYVTRSMFPIVPSFALTCHKSQGLTLDRVLIDLGSSVFDAGMAYVALSRSKQLSAITIIDLDATKIYCSKKAAEEYNRLRRTINLPPLKKFNNPPPSVKAKKKQQQRIQRTIQVYKPSVPQQRSTARGSQLINQNFFIPLTNERGESCYANATLQGLLRMVNLTAAIGVNNDPVLTTLQSFVNANAAQDTTVRNTNSLRFRTDQRFRVGTGQQCAREFLNAIIDRFPAQLQNMLIFEQLPARKCPYCQHPTEYSLVEVFSLMDLYPPPPQPGQTVRMTFNQLLHMQTQGHDMKLCATCKRNTPHIVTRTTTIPDQLRYLIVYLNRFGKDRHRFPVEITNFSSTNQDIYGKITHVLTANVVIGFWGITYDLYHQFSQYPKSDLHIRRLGYRYRFNFSKKRS
jgi:ubiquitin C-terminal hydrolase